MKNRSQLHDEYVNKYQNIPRDYDQRLGYIYDKYNITEKKFNEIINVRDNMIDSLYYTYFTIILYEEPDGAKRPRFRLVNRKNIGTLAMNNNDFIHVYSPNAKEDSVHMQRLVGEELQVLNNLIFTPCTVAINTFHRTPSSFNINDTILSEIGLVRPISYPDWDNIGKKYSDMFNSNIWLDDSLVIDGSVHKYYSILPRVEITIGYMNKLYNKNTYNKIIKRKDYCEEMNAQYFK